MQKRLPHPPPPAIPSDSRALLTPDARKQIDILFEQYIREVHAAELSNASKGFYIDFARYFVRWIDYDFLPGALVPGRRDSLRSQTE